MIPVWITEPTAPRSTKKLPENSKSLVVFCLSQVHAILEQINVNS